VLWELLHAPLTPHPLSWDPYRILVEVKYNNYRPNIDSALPQNVSSIVRRCWSAVPSERPDLSKLSREIQTIVFDLEAQCAQVGTLVFDQELSQVQTRKREFSRSGML